MLILTRKNRESIVIDDNIIITIISSKKGIVSVGIEAPREINIVRHEIIGKPKKVH